MEKSKLYVKVSGYMELTKEQVDEIENTLKEKRKMICISVSVPVDDYLRFKAEAAWRGMSLKAYMTYCATVVTDVLSADREGLV